MILQLATASGGGGGWPTRTSQRVVREALDSSKSDNWMFVMLATRRGVTCTQATLLYRKRFNVDLGNKIG
jgi:hypothetical protein